MSRAACAPGWSELPRGPMAAMTSAAVSKGTCWSLMASLV